MIRKSPSITSLIRFGLRQTVFFNLVFVILIIAGAFSLLSLPVERDPEINLGKVIISTYFPGANPTGFCPRDA